MKLGLPGIVLSLVATTASPVMAQSVDWSGWYGGLMASTNDGTQDYGQDGTVDYNLDGSTAGLFAGYAWANGPLVYGVEFAASAGAVYESELDGSFVYDDEYEYTRFLDLKGRVGYALNSVLLYGTLGVSRANFVDSTMGPGGKQTASGTIFGVGADYQFGKRAFAGAEYVRRSYDLDSDFSQVDSEVDTLSLRLGLRF